MTESEIVTKQAMCAVFAGLVVGLEAGDMAAAEGPVRILWPDELEMSGYEVAAECVLALCGALSVTIDTLMQIASIVKAELDEAVA